MKLTDYLIIFMMIVIPTLIMGNVKASTYDRLVDEKKKMNAYIDVAVADGTSMLLDHVTGNETVINHKRAIDTFYNTLFINLGIENSVIEKNRYKGYIPVILITESDGFVLIRKEAYRDKDNRKIIDDVVLPKMYYSYERDGYIYSFTIDDCVTVYNLVTNDSISGTRESLSKITSAALLKDETEFEVIRRNTINLAIQKAVNESIDNHNKIKKSYGSHYQFHSSLIEGDDWCETINGLAMVVVFQGMPMIGDGHYYSNVAVGGAELGRARKYYIQQSSENGLYYYHRESCPELSDFSVPVERRQEAAKKGAHPCKRCNP